MGTQSIVERVLVGVMGSFATLMAMRLSLISDVDLAMKGTIAAMAGLLVLSIVLGRFRRAPSNDA